MLTLMPLSGLQSALKRKNSKNYDFSRRGSLSVYSTYSLPTSKSSLRRFSSYEGLAPIFQQFLSQQQQTDLNNEISSPVPSPSPSPPPPPPPPEKRKRRASFSLGRRFRRLSGVGLSNDSGQEEGVSSHGNRRCSIDELDNLFARVREQLAQLKNEDIEICQRVDNLHNSVGDLCRQRCNTNHHEHHSLTSSLTTSLTATLSPTLRAPVVSHTSSTPQTESMLCRQSTTMPSDLSSNSLTVIRESSFEILDDDLPPADDDSSSDDEQSFEDYCRTNIPKLGMSHATRQPIKFSALDDVDLPVEHFDPKRYCLPNNLDVRPTSQSSPQLQLIKNNLSDSGSDSSQRWSVISVQSDSVLVTNKKTPSHSNQLFEL